MDGATVSFALTRLESIDGARVEVEGAWSGVRGMRFVRPALVVRQNGGERTLLATLEHKPWPAVDGEPWIASFPWEGGELDPTAVELAVAPSIVVPLAKPDRDADVDPHVALRHRLAEAEERTRRLDAEVGFLRREREERSEADQRSEGERDQRDERTAAERDAAVAAGAAAEAAREELRAERDALRDEREDLRAQRDALRAERDALRGERDALRAARDGGDELRSTRDALRAERDALRAERDDLRGERDDLRGERDAARRERGAVRGELHEVAAQRDDALSRPAGVVPVAARAPREHEGDAVRADWAARTAAILAVLVLLVLAITLLQAL
jgi:FtsZ-binding cell division protein ZapB